MIRNIERKGRMPSTTCCDGTKCWKNIFMKKHYQFVKKEESVLIRTDDFFSIPIPEPTR